MALTSGQRALAGSKADQINAQGIAFEELVGSRVSVTEYGVRLKPDQAEEILRLAKLGRAQEYLDESAQAAEDYKNG